VITQDPTVQQDPTVRPEPTVQQEIHEVVQWALKEKPPSRVGYFAALYWTVAKAIEKERHLFQHKEWLDELNHAFYRRYADAVAAYKGHRSAPDAWEAAFDAARNGKLLIVQHVLLGANAHINVDLAAATAETLKPNQLAAFERDFHLMNQVLGEVVDQTCRSLSRVWPFLRLVNRYFLREEDAVLKFSLSRAREHAWLRAQELVKLEGDALKAAIDDLNAEAVDIAHRIVKPDQPLGFLVQILRQGELRSVPRVINFIVDRAK